MAAGPIRALWFVHSALRASGADIAARCAALSSGAEVSSVADAIRAYTHTARGHAVAEDNGYFPTLSERAPNVTRAFSFDHDDEATHLDELDRLAGQCSDDELPALQNLARLVQRQMELHMRKEEEILWPLTEELFSVPEQGEIVQQILGAIPKQDMPQLLPWIVDQLGVDEAVSYVQTLAKVQPPEVFKMTVGWIKAGAAPARFAELTERIPDLAG